MLLITIIEGSEKIRLGDKVKHSIIYADLSFMANLLMDLGLIWATARLAGIRLQNSRWLAASFLGAVYGTLIIFPMLGFLYYLPVKLGISALLVWVGLHPVGFEQWKKSLLYFYLVSFMAAGATLAFPYIFLISPMILHNTWIWLAGGMLFLLFIGLRGEKLFIRRLIPELLRFGVSLNFGGRICNGTAFLDTGNGLRDPITCRPVIVAEYGLLQECMPSDVSAVLGRDGGEEEVLAAISSSSWANRIRIIPFRSVGRQHGLMVGLRADEVVVRIGEEEHTHKDLIIGVYRNQLSNDQSYRMLIPSALVHQQ